MPPLDQASTTHQPAPWTGEMVRNRLVEAFETERRMPGVGARRTASAWPANPVHSFADMVSWDVGEASERVMQAWERGTASPQEVTRMEQAMDWLRWVPVTERRCLEAWAKATVKGLNVKRMVKGTWSRSTFYRQRDHAAQTIANRLNKEGVRCEIWQINPTP